MANYTNESIQRLMKAIALAETEEECKALFDDLCTIKELQNMAMRLDTAILLSEGVNYLDISQQTGASTTTISRVSRCYNYGDGGYKNIIRKLKETENEDADQ